MPLPVNLVLVRHGRSAGNEANALSRKGDNSAFDDKFLDTHSQYWDLTEKGVRQAVQAGRWIHDYLRDGFFNRFYVSPYTRALKTAGLLLIPDAQWSCKVSLRERDRGEIDVIPDDVLKARYADVLQRKKRSAFFWRPPEGESLADVEQRIRQFLNTLEREASTQNVVIVCHGEVMWMFRFVLESMSLERFIELDESDNELDHIHNCQIIHYTREGIGGELRVSPSYKYMRSICPWDKTKSTNEWQEIVRKKLSNADILGEQNYENYLALYT